MVAGVPVRHTAGSCITCRVEIFGMQQRKEGISPLLTDGVVKDKPVCLICNEAVTVFNEYIIFRHFTSKHKNSNSEAMSEYERKQNVESLCKKLSGRQNFFKKGNTIQEAATHASYIVAYNIAKNNKALSDGEFVKQCMLQVCDVLCPDKKNNFQTVSLSRKTVTSRIESIDKNLTSQLESKIGQFKFCSIAMDESTDINDTAQLVLFIRGVDENFEITEELACMRSLKGTTKGCDIFREFQEGLLTLKVPITNVCNITTDGAPNMTGKKSGFLGLFNQNYPGNNVVFLHCVIHQDDLCKSALNMKPVLDAVVKLVNTIRSRGLTHKQFRDFLQSVQSEYFDVLYYTKLAKKDLSHFSRLNSIPSVNEEKLKNYEDGLKKLHFEFERRFQGFSAIQTELDIFTMSFNVNCEAVRSDLQLELIELQSNNHLKQSFLNMPKLVLQIIIEKLIYWIKWTIAYVAIQFHIAFQSKRFDHYDIFALGDPVKLGYVVPESEKEIESPFPESHLQEKADEVVFYGTNSNSECLLVRVARGPNQMADAWVYLKMADGKMYSLAETTGYQQPSEGNDRTFSCGKLQMHYLSPMRKWRIFYCGMLKETSGEKTQEVFVKFVFLWKASSDAYDCTLDTNPEGFASAMARSGWKTLFVPPIKKFTETFDLYAQTGTVSGTVSVDDGPEYEMYLFGEKIRSLGKDEHMAGCKFTTILGNIPMNGFKFHLLNASAPYIFNNLPAGFVVTPEGDQQTVKELEINLKPMCCGKKQTSFKAKFNAGEHYRISGHITEPIVLYSGQGWSGFLELSFIEFTIDCKKGCGIFMTGEVYEEQNRIIKPEPVPSLPEFIPLTVQFTDDASQFGEISGGKGSSLGKLTRLSEKEKSFIVPKGIVVTTSAYKEFLTPQILDAVKYLENVVYGKEPGDIKEACSKVSAIVEKALLPNKICRSITEDLQDLFGDGVKQRKFAVRSSATGEDTAAMSAAGQMDTFLGVQGLEEIFIAVKKCWASQFGHIAIEYKRRNGQILNSPMAVVIQEMVPCEVSGVMFTCDPVTNNPSVITITANYGLGETVVSGTVEPDTFILRRKDCSKLELESVLVGRKQQKIIMQDSGGVVVEDIDEDSRRDSCLSKETAEFLGKIAIKIEKFYRSSRDIEWGISNNKIYMLQSRPVTNAAAETENEMIHEFDPPLKSEREYFSTANVGEVLPDPVSPLGIEVCIKFWCNFFRRNALERGLGDHLFQTKYFQSAIYMFSNRMMASITEMISRYGVDTPSSKAFQISWYGRILDDPELLSQAKEQMTKKKITLSLKTRLLQYRDLYFFDFGLKKLKKKIDSYHRNFMKEKTAKDTLKALMNSCSDFDEEVVTQIANDIGHEKFKSMSIEEAENWLKTSNTQSSQLFQQFLKRHGHRCIQEFDVHSVTWGMDPKLLVKMLQSLAGASKESVKKEKSLDEIFSELHVPLTFMSKVFDHWRHGYRRLGKLMVSEGRLPDEDLIFYLTLDEIHDLLDTRSPSIISRANHRRKIVPTLHKFRFPEIMKGLPKPINEEDESEHAYVADLTMKGIPVSQGMAKGYARVAKTLEEASSLKAGEILITYCTDIGWSPYFPIIAGVVTEMGGLISHGAVVSREYGLPCVVGIEGAAKHFRTGDYVLLDGKKGVLQRLPQPEENSE
ncbi:Prodigiosin synthesizing transferase PigC [Araneus ventricosus]|uniref:Prodigiosin synthesizing transferase PigC n=1 Tax=Araneus ventricosus TaxID=182803 RepID=A0A4Y2G1S4_ARAVE|nr:Prodigiosin synthesizing transferase PigC [Araneus ventricosus]